MNFWDLLGIFEFSILQDLTLTDLDPEMILVNMYIYICMYVCIIKTMISHGDVVKWGLSENEVPPAKFHF